MTDSRGNSKTLFRIEEIANYYCSYILDQIIYEDDKIILKNFNSNKIDKLIELSFDYDFTIVKEDHVIDDGYCIKDMTEEILFYLKLKEIL